MAAMSLRTTAASKARASEWESGGSRDELQDGQTIVTVMGT
jgi:hypothetical protein